MEILKNRKGRAASEFIDTRPDLPVHNLDKVAARFKAFSMMPSSFTSEEGLSATEVFNKSLDREADNIIERYSPHFVLNSEFANLIIKEGKAIAWNKEALKIFIHTEYPSLFSRLKRYMNIKLLEWAKVDYSLFDGEQMNQEVEKALIEFAYQYINNLKS